MQATTTHFKCLIAHAGLVNSEAQWGTSDVIWGRELMNGGAPWVPTKTWAEQNPMRYAANFKTPMLLTVGENDFQWINIPLNGIAAGQISRLVVCYQVVGAGGSYISQVRLAEMSAPNSAVVKVDDPTDLNSNAATCYATKAGYVVGGTTTLSLKVVLKPGDKIIVGGISVIR
jgi:hypothetical protein